MKITRQLRSVAQVLLDGPPDEMYGYRISARAEISTRKVYPLLARLVEEGWLEVCDRKGVIEGRPMRRLYIVTELGETELRAITEEEPDE